MRCCWKLAGNTTIRHSSLPQQTGGLWTTSMDSFGLREALYFIVNSLNYTFLCFFVSTLRIESHGGEESTHFQQVTFFPFVQLYLTRTRVSFFRSSTTWFQIFTVKRSRSCLRLGTSSRIMRFSTASAVVTRSWAMNISFNARCRYLTMLASRCSIKLRDLR